MLIGSGGIGGGRLDHLAHGGDVGLSPIAYSAHPSWQPARSFGCFGPSLSLVSRPADEAESAAPEQRRSVCPSSSLNCMHHCIWHFDWAVPARPHAPRHGSRRDACLPSRSGTHPMATVTSSVTLQRSPCMCRSATYIVGKPSQPARGLRLARR